MKDKTKIRSVTARQVFSGRGHPGVEATIVTENGAVGIVHATAGVSVGTHEIAFQYDGGTKWRGMGVTQAVRNVNEIIGPALIGLDSANQMEIDHVMLNLRGPDTKVILGGNATAAVSAAVLKAGANALDIPLYQHIGGNRAVTLPNASFGCIGGSTRYGTGLKAGSKPSYSFVAYDFESYSEAVHALWEVFSDWKRLMAEKWALRPIETSEGWTSGGFVNIPPGYVESDEVLWQMLTETINKRGYENRMGIQVDVASDSFYNHDEITYEGLFFKGKRDRDEQIALIIRMTKDYPFVIIEDPLFEDDFEGHATLVKETDIQIVGDDLFTTNPQRVEHGVALSSANTVLLKVNQIGSITESLEMIQLAYENGYAVMPCSSRGENIDICDYSVGINAGTIRETGLGSPAVRFMQIERELGRRARYAGKAGLKGSRFEVKGGE